MHEGLQVPVVVSSSSCHYALILSGLCRESTSLPLEKHYVLAIKGGLTKKQFQVLFMCV